MSLLSLLGIARSALMTHQRAMSVISHNIANAQTPGYSRQRLDLVPASPEMTSFGAMGRGVTASGLSRARDVFLDLSLRSDQGQLGHAGTRLDVLGRVNDALLEPGGDGVASAFDDLVQSFADLSSDPAGGPSRELVRGAAQRFVDQLHRMSTALDEAETDARSRLTSQVGEVNAITKEIAELNANLVGSGATGAADLLDRRDLLIDRLSLYGNVRALPQADGGLTVVLGSQTVVSGATAEKLEVRALTGGGWGVATSGGPAAFDPGTGSLQALSTLTSSTIPGMRAKLDAYAEAAVTQVNARHRTGYTRTGATGVDFFDATGITARTIALDAAQLASTDAIAAALTPAPGDGNNALLLSGIGSVAIVGLGGRSLREHYASFVAEVGTAVQSADRDAMVYQTLADRDETRRQSVSGVSVDEEMIQMIGEQQAYSAAARMVRMADEMMQELLSMV